jgi:hypothetical protein
LPTEAFTVRVRKGLPSGPGAAVPTTRPIPIDERVHLWTFKKVRGGVHAPTEETLPSDQVEADVPTATAVFGAGLEAWPHDLKAAAEARTGAP